MQLSGYSADPRAVIEAAAPCGGAATSITWGLRVRLTGRCAEQGRQILQLRYGGHALGLDHAASFQLPVLVLLKQYRPYQACDRGVVGEVCHLPSAAVRLPVAQRSGQERSVIGQ